MDIRRLYDEGIEGWDHAASGYITGYLIVVACCVCVGLLLAKGAQRFSETKHLVVLLGCNAGAFGFGGATHHMLDVYYNRGEAMGTAWGEDNSGWMFAWLLTSLAAPGAMALVALAFSIATCAKEARYSKIAFCIVYGFGTVIALAELVIFVTGNMGLSGTLSVVVSIFAGLIATGLSVVDIAKSGFMGWRVLFALGSVHYFLAFFFLAFLVPGSCTEVNYRDDCPFPYEFNQHALFHIIVIISIVCLFLAVSMKGMAGDSVDQCAG